MLALTVKKMRILDVATDLYNGCYLYRNKTPFSFLKDRGHQVDVSLGQAALRSEDYDLVHMSRGYDGNYNDIAFIFKSKGIPIVYDIDDAMDLVDPVNVNYEAVHRVLPSYFYLLNFADLVTVTTPLLAAHVKQFAPKTRVEVMPNMVDASLWRRRAGSAPTELRIGFSGSNTHIADVVLAMQAVKVLKDRWRKDRTKPRITFCLFGFSRYPDHALDWIAKNRTALAGRPNHPFLTALTDFERAYRQIGDCIEWYSMVPIEVYPEFMAKMNLDIGCAPLVDNEFNHMKSSIKMYEYAMVGTLGVCSDVDPFKHEAFPNRIDNDPEKWADLFERYVADPKWREKKMEEQQAFVQQLRTMDERQANHLESLYQDLIKNKKRE